MIPALAYCSSRWATCLRSRPVACSWMMAALDEEAFDVAGTQSDTGIRPCALPSALVSVPCCHQLHIPEESCVPGYQLVSSTADGGFSGCDTRDAAYSASVTRERSIRTGEA